MKGLPGIIYCDPPAATELGAPRLLRPLATKVLLLMSSCLFFDLWPRSSRGSPAALAASCTAHAGP